LDVVVFDGDVVGVISGEDAEVLGVLDGEILDGDVVFVIESDESIPVERDVCSVDDDIMVGICFDGDRVVGGTGVLEVELFVVGGVDGVGGFGEGEPGVGFCSGVVVVSVFCDVVGGICFFCIYLRNNYSKE
jgi:hypothetical protein